MKEETESARIQPEKPSSSPTAGTNAAVAPSSGCQAIDFHSPEFNRGDDLNDCSGNYRNFQTLDGIVTADERHRIERRRREGTPDGPPVDDTVPAAKIEAAREETGAFEAAPPLTVISKGRTLIIDTDEERAMACGKILGEAGLLCTLFITNCAPTRTYFSGLSRISLLEVDAVSVTGAFGGFSATVTPGGDRKHPPKWFDDAAVFDLVLDLQPAHSFAGDLLPLGYYAPGPGTAAFDEAMAELPEMRGQFKKARLISFMESRCFHGRSRVRDCRRCLEVCPVGAVQSAGRKIVVNHYLCQGCGGCALVCPADALRVVQPSQEEMVNSLRTGLKNRAGADDFTSGLVISDPETACGNRLPGAGESGFDHWVRFEVEQIAHARLDVLLAALAYGAGEVLVACGPRNPPGIAKAVESQVRMARAVLRGLGLPEEKVRFSVIPAGQADSERAAIGSAGFDRRPNHPPMPPAAFSPGHDKRALVRLAARHLYENCGANQPCFPLTADTPFGAVSVDAAACTLCMACVAACPSGALSADGNVPRLALRESRCHQCGLCMECCPEGAIRLLPRLLCDPGAVEAPAVLHEAEPFRCIECGEPFASPAMINRMEEKLMGHWMYNNERQLRRLRMCSTCRTRDALSSRDMESWNP